MTASKIATMAMVVSGTATADQCTSLVQTMTTIVDPPLETTATMIAMRLELRPLLFVLHQACIAHSMSKAMIAASSPFVMMRHLPFPLPTLMSTDLHRHNPAEVTSNRITIAIGRAKVKAGVAIEVDKDPGWPRTVHSSKEIANLRQS